MYLTVYSRSGCHLCDDMLDRLSALQPDFGYRLVVIDIVGDRQLEERFGHKVPVLFGGDREICHYFLDEQALRDYLGSP